MSVENSSSGDSTKENLEVVSSVDTEKNVVTSPTNKFGASNDVELISAISKQKGDQAEWPQDNIKEPHQNDVLYGRGGGTNHHPGNKRYRMMVECRKADYVNSKRLDKPLVALEIIKAWREQDPPGRFLKMDEDTGLWKDVGDKKAREKTSQALREKTPLQKKQHGDMDYGPVEVASGNYLRCDDPPQKKLDYPLTLQRDHSLGRDIIEPTEKVAVDNFTWDSGLVSVPEGDSNYGVESTWIRRPPEAGPEHIPIDPYNQMTSPHLHGMNPSFTASLPHPVSDGWSVSRSNPITPVRSAHPCEGYDWPQHQVEAVDGPPSRWIHHNISSQPVDQVPRGVDASPARWTSGGEYNHEPSLSQENGGQHVDERCNTNVGNRHFAQVADTFNERDWRKPDNGYGSHYYNRCSDPVEYDKWASPPTPRQSNKYDSRGLNGTDAVNASNDDPFEPHEFSKGQVQGEEPFGQEFRSRSFSPGIPVGAPTVSPSEASIPSTSSLPLNSHSDTSPRRKRDSNIRSREYHTPVRQGKSNSWKSSSLRIDSPMGKLSIAKPPPVKRDTSNQNENSETKPSVKKMNRQRSLGNRPEYLHKVSEKEVVSLGNSLEQSSLENSQDSDNRFQRPEKINISDRNRTIDSFDIAIEKRILQTEDLPENSDVVPADCSPSSTPPRSTPFSFPEHESPENKSHNSSNLSVPPLFLTNDDRLSSLGSVEVTDISDFVNPEPVKQN